MTAIFGFAAAALARTKKKSDVEQHLEFETVYREYFTFVWRSLRGLGVAEAAIDDAAQDVFVVVHRKLHTISQKSKIKSWVFGVARRVASDYRRTVRRKGVPLEFDDTTTQGELPSPYKQIESKETLQLIESFLNELNDEHRSIFVLAEIEQLPVSTVSEILGVNMNTIYSRLKIMRNDLSLFMVKKFMPNRHVAKE